MTRLEQRDDENESPSETEASSEDEDETHEQDVDEEGHTYCTQSSRHPSKRKAYPVHRCVARNDLYGLHVYLALRFRLRTVLRQTWRGQRARR